jgi:hypothetical protein
MIQLSNRLVTKIRTVKSNRSILLEYIDAHLCPPPPNCVAGQVIGLRGEPPSSSGPFPRKIKSYSGL